MQALRIPSCDRLVWRRRYTLGMSLFCLGVALVEALQAPLASRPVGAWDFLFGPLWEAAGSAGLVGFWLLLALCFSACSVGFHRQLRRTGSPARLAGPPELAVR